MSWRFILPLPPSINQQYTERDGRRVLSREARHYKEHLAKAFRQLKAQGKLKWDDETQQGEHIGSSLRLFDAETDAPKPRSPKAPMPYLHLRLEFFFKTPQRRDLDNGLKIVQDLVCNALGVDDRNVVSVELIKRVDAQNPRLEVTVNAFSEWDFSASTVAMPVIPSSSHRPIAPSPIDLRTFVPPLSKAQRTETKFSLSDWLAEHEL